MNRREALIIMGGTIGAAVLESLPLNGAIANHRPRPTPTPTAAPTPTATPTPSPTPSPTPTGGLPPIRQLSYVATPNTPRPGYLSPITDPTWGTQVTRITNTAGLRHAYARIQPWNADGSKLLMGYAPSTARLLDGNTYADIRGVWLPDYCLWSNVDPSKAYGVYGNKLVSLNPATSTGAADWTTIRDFGAAVSIGNYEGGLSDDDSRMALSAGGTLYIVDPRDGSTVASCPLPSGLDNFQVSRDGQYVVYVFSNVDTRKASVAAPATMTQLYPHANHGDNWLDVVYSVPYFVGNNCPAVKAFALTTAQGAQVEPAGTAFEYGHTSGRGPEIVLSNYDPATMAGRPGCDQMVSIATDGSGVRVWAHAHTSGATYASQPHAVPSRDGRRVLFASDWGGAVYAYVANA